MRNAPIVPGVPTPYTMHVHPYPTRFHGAIYTRPVFGAPVIARPQDVFTPGYNIDREVPQPTLSGLGATVGKGMLWDTGDGVFKPGGYGGGVFDGDISGLGSLSRRRSVKGIGVSGLGADSADMPWREKSNATVALQSTINAHLLGMGMCPIGVDGKMGGGTCGAARYVLDKKGDTGDGEMPDVCAAHRSEWVAPKKNTGNCGAPAAAPAVVTASSVSVPTNLSAGMSSGTKRALGFALGGVLAIGAVMMLRRK